MVGNPLHQMIPRQRATFKARMKTDARHANPRFIELMLTHALTRGIEDSASSEKHDIKTVFYQDLQAIADDLKGVIDKLGNRFDTLVEIGCGNGEALSFFHKQFSGFKRLIGVDVSKAQTESNRETYQDPQIEFIAADGLAWLTDNCRPNMVVISVRGALDAYIPFQLANLFEKTSKLGPIIFIVIQPNEIRHDHFASHQTSRPTVHNYLNLMSKSGYRTWHNSRTYYLEFGQKMTLLGTLVE